MTTPPFHEALDHFTSVFADREVAHDVGPRFSCSELDALADLLRAAGCPNVADEWVRGHAVDDDEGDSHFQIGVNQGRLFQVQEARRGEMDPARQLRLIALEHLLEQVPVDG